MKHRRTESASSVAAPITGYLGSPRGAHLEDDSALAAYEGSAREQQHLEKISNLECDVPRPAGAGQ